MESKFIFNEISNKFKQKKVFFFFEKKTNKFYKIFIKILNKLKYRKLTIFEKFFNKNFFCSK